MSAHRGDSLDTSFDVAYVRFVEVFLRCRDRVVLALGLRSFSPHRTNGTGEQASDRKSGSSSEPLSPVRWIYQITRAV